MRIPFPKFGIYLERDHMNRQRVLACNFGEEQFECEPVASDDPQVLRLVTEFEQEEVPRYVLDEELEIAGDLQLADFVTDNEHLTPEEIRAILALRPDEAYRGAGDWTFRRVA